MGNVTAERLRRLAEGARATAAEAQTAREARDTAIGEADDTGYKIREIARHTRMSPSHVQRIVVAETARRQAERQGPPGID